MLRTDLTNYQLPAGRLSRARKTVLLSKVTLLGINNFSVVWIENLSNFKHFHISAMSNNRITADYECFCELAVVTATRPSRRRSFDRFNYSPSKGETQLISCQHADMDGNRTYRHWLGTDHLISRRGGLGFFLATSYFLLSFAPQVFFSKVHWNKFFIFLKNNTLKCNRKQQIKKK